MTLLELAKQAGTADAEQQFGLRHGTPKPPATWTQRWQDDPVKSVKKRVTIPSMSQVALRGA